MVLGMSEGIMFGCDRRLLLNARGGEELFGSSTRLTTDDDFEDAPEKGVVKLVLGGVYEVCDDMESLRGSMLILSGFERRDRICSGYTSIPIHQI